MLLDKLRYLSRVASFVVFSGSLPRDVDDDFYAEAIRELNRRGVPCVVDCEGEPLRYGVEAEPFLVSPNQREAESLVGQEFSDDADFLMALDTIADLGARNVLITQETSCFALVREERTVRQVPRVDRAHRADRVRRRRRRPARRLPRRAIQRPARRRRAAQRGRMRRCVRARSRGGTVRPARGEPPCGRREPRRASASQRLRRPGSSSGGGRRCRRCEPCRDRTSARPSASRRRGSGSRRATRRGSSPLRTEA